MNGSSIQGHIEINVNKDEQDFAQKMDTGLAADLFSEEEIEELKKRLEYERLPKGTLKKRGGHSDEGCRCISIHLGMFSLVRTLSLFE